ncbi:hypothetical protein SPHV1_230063 [Novosphingobium sp. KN65.2]|nr:hypothetical protein SPHV1_230063 [Novosphingobium sp. KN65.2]
MLLNRESNRAEKKFQTRLWGQNSDEILTKKVDYTPLNVADPFPYHQSPWNWPKGAVVYTVNLQERYDYGDAVDQPLCELQRRDFDLQQSDLLDHTIPPSVNRLAWLHLREGNHGWWRASGGSSGTSRVQSQNYPPETARNEGGWQSRLGSSRAGIGTSMCL